jgi:hypothetical protein
MASNRLRAVWSLLASLLLMSAFGAAAWAAGSDTPTLGNTNGDCWKTGTPYWCRSNWAGRSTSIAFRAIDRFSSQRPAWLTPAKNAASAWSSAPGPQTYSFTAASNDTWIYLNYSSTGQHGLTSDNTGRTWNCNAGICVDYDTSMQVVWSDVYLNHDNLDNDSAARIQNTIGHESGHGMGLAHNLTDSASLMWSSQTTVPGPNAHDIGIFPGCAPGGHGVRCVYGSGD